MIHNFSKGLNTDVQVSLQPEGTYRFALNFVHNTTEGEQGAISNEPGTVVYCTLPEGFKIIGKTVLNDDIILFLVNSGTCIIGTIDTRLSAPTFIAVYDGRINTNVNSLGFSINNPIEALARIDYKGNRLVYFTDNTSKPKILNLDLTLSDIAAMGDNLIRYSNQQFDYNILKVGFVSIVENGGNLKTGTYQFAARFVNRTDNRSPIGVISEVIPVGKDGPFDTNIDNFDGDYDKDSGRAIKVNITCSDFLANIYPKVELIVIRYGYPSQVPIIEVVKTLTNTGNTISTVYTGNELVLEQLPIEAITVKPVIYDTVKCLEQLQGRLFRSNMTSNTDTLPFQKVANYIRGEWVITSISPSQGYKNIDNVINYKGYQRGEVYAFGIVFLYKDGRESAAYHIPADSAWSSNAVALGGGRFTPGKYQSTEFYPSGQNYPSGNILHYKAPTASQTPHFDASNFYPLGIEFTGINTALNSGLSVSERTEFDNTIAGYVIVRLDRLKKGNRSIYAQGYVSPIQHTYRDSWTGAGKDAHILDWVGRSPLLPFTVLTTGLTGATVSGFSSKTLDKNNDTLFTIPVSDTYNSYSLKKFGKESDNAGADIAGPGVVDGRSGDGFRHEGTTGRFFHLGHPQCFTAASSEVNNVKNFTFFSPEAIFEKLPNTSLSLQTILSTLIVAPSATKLDNGMIVHRTAGGMEPNSQTFRNWFWNPYTNSGVTSAIEGATPIPLTKVQYQSPRGEEALEPDYSIPLETGFGTKSLIEYQQIDSAIITLSSPYFSSYTDPALTNKHATMLKVGSTYDTISATTSPYSDTNPSTWGWGSLAGKEKGIYAINNSNYYAPIVNLISPVTNQYGSTANQDYLPVKVFTSESVISNSNGNTIQCFNGDTYIAKVGFKQSSAYPQRVFDPGSPDQCVPGNKDDIVTQSGGNIRYLTYLVYETTINTSFRHEFSQDLNSDGDTTDKGERGIPYYPKSIAGNVLGAAPALGEAKSINTQYNFQNFIYKYYSLPESFSIQRSFSTRTDYSEQGLEGEVFDAYREFRPGNFQDVPKNKGEIWDTFVYNNNLYVHTPRTLFKTSVNPIAQQGSSVGDIVLGIGGVFQLPPQELFTISGGYAGSISQFAGQLTPFGYIFPDVLQGKLFIFSEGIAEVNEGLTRYFQNNFKLIPSEVSYNDNPFNSKGVLSGYDYDFQRYLITYFDKAGNSATLSYYPKLKLWSSFHSYKPNYYISADNKFFSGNINLHKHNEGLFGNYYGVEYDSSLQLITNEAVLATKVFDNQIVNMQNRNSNSIIVDRTGDTAYWETETDSTAFDIAGVKTPNSLLYNQTFVPTHTDNEVLTSYDNKEYRLAIPRNNVINYQGGLGVTNLDTLTSGKATRLFNLRNRLKGKYLISNFTFNNSQNYKLIINYIQSIFRKNER